MNLLEQAGAITSSGRGFTAADIEVDAAVKRAAGIAEAAERVDRTRVEMLRGFAESVDCRRRRLLAYFGETLTDPCENCDRCDEGASSGVAAESAVPLNSEVQHREWGHGVVLSGEADRITVLFDEYGYRTLSLAAVSENHVLTVLSS